MPLWKYHARTRVCYRSDGSGPRGSLVWCLLSPGGKSQESGDTNGLEQSQCECPGHGTGLDDHTQQEDIDPDEVGKVDEHDSVVGGLPGGGIEADSSHKNLPTTLDKVAIGSHAVKATSIVDQDLGLVELHCPLLNLHLHLSECPLSVLGRAASRKTAELKAGSFGPPTCVICRDEASLDQGCAIGSFAELDLGDNV